MHGKFSAAYDETRQKIYWIVHNGWFCVLDLDGNVEKKQQILVGGPNGTMQYPSFCMDPAGVLHMAWTTVDLPDVNVPYWAIHYMRSSNGGTSWETLDGATLNAPITGDETGPTDRITLDDEFTSSSWLSNFRVYDGKVHFTYMAMTNPVRQHYMRYDVNSSVRELDVFPSWTADGYELYGGSGFFAARSSLADGPLYSVGRGRWDGSGYHAACFASDDNGETWYFYGESPTGFSNMYALGGCRDIAADGLVIGSFTNALSTPPKVYFVKFQAGLSRAEVVGVQWEYKSPLLTFENIRGRPQHIRFRKSGGDWGVWLPFAESVHMRDRQSEYFQLRSRLHTVSSQFAMTVQDPMDWLPKVPDIRKSYGQQLNLLDLDDYTHGSSEPSLAWSWAVRSGTVPYVSISPLTNVLTAYGTVTPATGEGLLTAANGTPGWHSQQVVTIKSSSIFVQPVQDYRKSAASVGPFPILVISEDD